MGKIKGTLSEVSADIKPYISKKLFEKYLDDSALSTVSRLLLSKYSNVTLSVYLGADGRSYLKVVVEKFMCGGELDILLAPNKKSKGKDSLEWIDRIEELDALL